MFLKSVAYYWASSKLEKEEARTQSLIRELDRAKASASKRIQNKKSECSHKIKAHQEKRNKELKTYIDFMNEQLEEITADYLPELNQFQSFTLTCVDSWMRVDLCQQEIDIVSQKLSAVVTTISLLDAYISELGKLSQRQGRHAWREFTAARKLTVTNDFVEKTKDRIDRTSKSNHDEFKNELKRLESHLEVLKKDRRELCTERTDLSNRKEYVDQQHKANKKALIDKHKLCVEHWSQIAKKFEAYYAFEVSELSYVNDWISNLRKTEALPEIKKLIEVAKQSVSCASENHKELEAQRKRYASRVKKAHDTKEYPDSFENDKSLRDHWKHAADDAWEDLNKRRAAQSLIGTRRDELHGYIARIEPLLHPDVAIDAMREILNSDREFNAWLAFGINTSKQKREYWEKKQNRIENASTN
ncbi:hypothetical protein SAMN05216419_10653 [Nitrosomonas cryotolerans]|uniref:Uncharacterized protein n=1 Tax=Nitrosomonas cryotolerans ATCC 49181 TaxID=1131553 RepID=A0A1N6JXQ8_9PROT|nr:hypothetical protein [Nitrosomonas cryotolerans]SFQ11306.1 hypothetical protein SAMN05216419_10653 [Nitrosomonas cryotolerans]SIO49134.1 hypothetical protein SAMN02743940_0017 [Nitrosomonas cryotolerans ATCC 49181]